MSVAANRRDMIRAIESKSGKPGVDRRWGGAAETEPQPTEKEKQILCAIYARKSSEEGLEQSFNSLDAQRESCENYIASQRSEGWIAIPERYEDGGISGGTMERPALKRLISDIQSGRVHCVLVYKLDRLSRSLRDFLNIMELLEKHGVGLVSVTQSFNTANSSGRLMVNLLLAFAQFEREIGGERTRDKIALSRRKGEWTGGRPVLGYDIGPGGLVLNPQEAAQVRQIFGWYLELRSVDAVLQRVHTAGITNKVWVTKKGTTKGGANFSKSSVWGILTNPLFIGRVPHKGKTYVGKHAGIVEESVFDRGQQILAENARCSTNVTRNTTGGLLKGLLICGGADGCGCGRPLGHTFTTAATGKQHRYYICKSGSARCKAARIPAEDLEAFVIKQVRESLDVPTLATLVLDIAREETMTRVRDLEARAAHLRGDLRLAEEGSAMSPQGNVFTLNKEIAAVERELGLARESLVDREAVEAGLLSFDPLWANLNPSERQKLLGLLIERLDLDVKGGELRVVWKSEDEETNLGQAKPGDKQGARV